MRFGWLEAISVYTCWPLVDEIRAIEREIHLEWRQRHGAQIEQWRKYEQWLLT